MKRKNINRTGLNGKYTLSESPILVMYDLHSDKLRRKVFIACEDYGLKAIQFSVFFGLLSPNKYNELFLRLKKIAGDESNNIMIIPVCKADFKKILRNGEKLSYYQTDFMECL